MGLTSRRSVPQATGMRQRRTALYRAGRRKEKSRMKLVLRVLINALALGAAAYLVPGIQAGGFVPLLLTGLVFGVLNALVRPFLKLLSCPLIVLTLGLFTLVLNAVMLLLTEKVGQFFGIAFAVEDFWSAFFGALIVSVVSVVLSWALIDDARR
jgi:putative membrane protein